MMESSKPLIPTPGFLIAFFIVMICTFIRPSTCLASNYVGDDCHNKAPQALSDLYKANLDQLLSLLSTDAAATNKGYNHTAIGNATNTVYGLYDCRGDDPGYLCQFCVSTATRELLQRCPNHPSAAIWYSYCIVRYSNENFFGKVMMSPLWSMEGTTKMSDPTEWKKAESYIRSLMGRATEKTKELNAWGEFDLGGGRRRHALVQCSRDLDRKSCRQCLEALMNNVTQCCEQKQGWHVGTPSCIIKYNDYMFYQSPSSQNPTTANDGAGKSKFLIISVSLLVAVPILSISVYLWRRKTRKDQTRLEGAPMFYDFPRRERSLNTDLPTIPLHVIQQSTNHFSEDSKLGEGGFGTVYKGTLPDGKEIAVKRLSKASGQGSKEFKNEVIFIAKLQHRNLVRLLGCCIEKNEKLLVYEYMPNSSLDFHLFSEEKRKKLDWNQRLNIINGIAKGLLYLHEDSRLRVVHRDLKASNVLLDNKMNPKISDFGLARTFEGAQNEGNTKRVIGTYGYMAPEYAMEGLFSVKSDAFSFGVLLLEIICGKKICSFYLSEHGQSLLIYTWNLWCKGKCLELMDPVLEDSYIENEVLKCVHIGLLCVQEDPDDRPIMSTVVLMLASDTMTLPNPNPPAFSRRKSLEDQSSTSRTFNDASVNEMTVSHLTPR
ncbi:cysteine-rich receptor-like protein kinase 10 [Prosopis cineraria]|uniref:cysteine-rich receptor-like protein kinase 10 n=1 Tax=Prosopis cineraria TaxID=364024 RepID=UPI00240EBDA1|nr:cysteine-rich receptor-like protein kinase 10 [Prosopis cineraria]